MKGQAVIKFDVPNRGLITNVPQHLVGSDALVGGNDVFVDLDGRLKTRRGSVSVTGSAVSPAERILGIGSYEDNVGAFFPVAGTTKRWQALIGGTWTDISGGSLLSGSINDPVRFTSFGSSNLNWLIGCNNSDAMRQWNSGLAAYSTIAAAPISRDVLTLANRVVAFNTQEGGTRFPFRVRWSSINDQTTWPALAFADLLDSGSSIVGAALTSRLSAVIYRQFSGWLMEAVPGGDANAFAFERIPAGDNMTGPVGAAAIVIAEGSHFYFGIDGRIYQYNGSSIQPISDPVDPIVRGLWSNANATRFPAAYVPATRQLVFFFATGQTDPNMALVYDLRRQAWEPLWTFSYSITAAAEVRDAAAVAINWTNWVSPSATWLTEPYATWDSIPGPGSGTSGQLACYIGDTSGNISRFGVGVLDNGAMIAYSAKWAQQRVSDETTNTLVHFIEIYQQQTMQAESVVASLMGLLQPLGVGSEIVLVTSLTLKLTDQTTFYQTLPPGPSAANNVKSNLLQLILNGAGAAGGLNFSGAVLLVDWDYRSDPGP